MLEKYETTAKPNKIHLNKTNYSYCSDRKIPFSNSFEKTNRKGSFKKRASLSQIYSQSIETNIRRF